MTKGVNKSKVITSFGVEETTKALLELVAYCDDLKLLSEVIKLSQKEVLSYKEVGLLISKVMAKKKISLKSVDTILRRHTVTEYSKWDNLLF